MNSISMKIYSVCNSEGNCSWFTIVATSTRRPSFSFKLSKSKHFYFDKILFNYLNLTFTCKRFRSRCMFKSLSWLYKLIWKIAIWFHIYIYFLIYRTIPNPGHDVHPVHVVGVGDVDELGQGLVLVIYHNWEHGPNQYHTGCEERQRHNNYDPLRLLLHYSCSFSVQWIFCYCLG